MVTLELRIPLLSVGVDDCPDLLRTINTTFVPAVGTFIESAGQLHLVVSTVLNLDRDPKGRVVEVELESYEIHPDGLEETIKEHEKHGWKRVNPL